MEPVKSALRYVLVLGKVQVIKIDKGTTGQKITVDMSKGVTAMFDCPPRADVRLGDYLTIYTEVLVDAEPTHPSVQ